MRFGEQTWWNNVTCKGWTQTVNPDRVPFLFFGMVLQERCWQLLLIKETSAHADFTWNYLKWFLPFISGCPSHSCGIQQNVTGSMRQAFPERMCCRSGPGRMPLWGAARTQDRAAGVFLGWVQQQQSHGGDDPQSFVNGPGWSLFLLLPLVFQVINK